MIAGMVRFYRLCLVAKSADDGARFEWGLSPRPLWLRRGPGYGLGYFKVGG
jgi:hypothetical protein